MTEPPIGDSPTKALATSEMVILAFSVLGTILTLAWVLWFSRYGIEFTDEGFYLVWISNPFNYNVSATQFGFVYHPLYELLSGNIAALRQANILITFTLAWVLGNVFLKAVFSACPLEPAPRLIISAALATSSLLVLALWLPTPNYNSLALQALLIAATGLLLAEKEVSGTSIAGWLLIGAGGWLSFMAKPTTAAALGLCAVVYLLLAGKLSIRLLTVSLTTALILLVLSALMIDGSVLGFIHRLQGGVEAGNALLGSNATTKLLRLDDFYLGESNKILLIAGTGLFACASYFASAKNNLQTLVATVLSISFVLLGAATVCGLTPMHVKPGLFLGLLIWSIPFAGLLVGLALSRLQVLLYVTRGQWAMALSFAVFPHIYAFGTGNNYWSAGASAGIFWIFAGLALLGPIAAVQRPSVLLLPLALAAQLVTTTLVDISMRAPYRQPSLRANDFALEVGRKGSTLVLSDGFSRYFSEATNVATRAGFKSGTPMLDMSGQSPGTLYALGAKSTGQAWILGGYPGSEKQAILNLRRVSCEEIASLWLLTEPGGPREIPPTILDTFGINASRDFEVAGEIHTPPGAGGYSKSRLQQILRPTRPSPLAQAACEHSRIDTK